MKDAFTVRFQYENTFVLNCQIHSMIRHAEKKMQKKKQNKTENDTIN